MFRIWAKKWPKLHQNGNILQILGLFCSFLTIICSFCAKFRHFWPQNHDFWAKNSKISYISLNILKKFHISKILFWKLFWGKIHRKSYREEFFWEISLKNPIVKKILEEYPQKIPSWRKFLANIHWTSNCFKNWTSSRPTPENQKVTRPEVSNLIPEHRNTKVNRSVQPSRIEPS